MKRGAPCPHPPPIGQRFVSSALCTVTVADFMSRADSQSRQMPTTKDVAMNEEEVSALSLLFHRQQMVARAWALGFQAESELGLWFSMFCSGSGGCRSRAQPGGSVHNRQRFRQRCQPRARRALRGGGRQSLGQRGAGPRNCCQWPLVARPPPKHSFESCLALFEISRFSLNLFLTRQFFFVFFFNFEI